MDTTVKTGYGLVSGVEEENYIVYRAIPFAKPPVGELRWKKPERPDAWEGVYKADTFAPKCMQSASSFGLYQKEFYTDAPYQRERSEDGLYLNIWAPKDAIGDPEKKLPVAFWIHGGGFSGGYSSEEEFDGEEYVKRGVILVSIAYRLGIFGFLALPELNEEDEHSVSGNYGMYDQIAALTWVYENIAQFGGDPSNITIHGQSAGCMSVQNLISSDLTGNMINKAILMSGLVVENKKMFGIPTLAEAMENGEEFRKLAGGKSLKELRAMPALEIQELAEKLTGQFMDMGKGLVIVPNIDGYVLKEHVGDMAAAAKEKNIAYMAGSVASDIGGPGADGGRGPLAEEIVKFCQIASEKYDHPAYAYYFSRDLPGDDAGAFHSAELWYTFGTLGRCWRPMEKHDYELSEKMVDAWTSFMKDGKPSSDPEWRPCTEADPYVKEFC